VLGRASSRRLEADFAPLGRVAIKVLTRGQRAQIPPQPGCEGKPSLIAGGGFRGVVEFKGEQGIPPFSTHRGGGIFLEKHSKQVCNRGKRRHHSGRGHGGGQQSVKLALLTARARSGDRHVNFEDIRISDPELELTLSLALGSVEERLGAVQISRSALEIGDGSELRLSKPGSIPETAAVSPPKPFTGTGTYSASPPAAPTWTGDLGVHLPGAGLVPFTGAGFKARFCRADSFKELGACERGASRVRVRSRALAAAELALRS
jgi:hypothetical protein